MPPKESLLQSLITRLLPKKNIDLPTPEATPVAPKKEKASPLTKDQIAAIENLLLSSDTQGKKIENIATQLSITPGQLRSYMYRIGPFIVGEEGGTIWVKNPEKLPDRIAQMQKERRQTKRNQQKSRESEEVASISDEEIIRRLHVDRGEE